MNIFLSTAHRTGPLPGGVHGVRSQPPPPPTGPKGPHFDTQYPS